MIEPCSIGEKAKVQKRGMEGDQETRRTDESSMNAFRPTQTKQIPVNLLTQEKNENNNYNSTMTVAMIPHPLLTLVPSPLFLFLSMSSVWSASPASITRALGLEVSSRFPFAQQWDNGQWTTDGQSSFFAEVLFCIISFLSFLL